MKKTLLFTLLVILAASCQDSEKNKVYILSFSGMVTVNSGQVKSTGYAIEFGNTIETAKNSFCDIIINDKNIIRLKENTRLVFNIYGKSNELVVGKGWIAAVIRKKFTREGSFTIITPTSTASIRGTSFCIKVENDRNTYFCVCNGSVSLNCKGDAGSESVTAAEHAARRFTLDKKTGFVTIDRDPGLLYHDDAGLEGLAGIINEKIDWTQPDIF
ncbi:MAG TPA: FecR domain-containing protein [Spirochaetota bacterium]|nr:FecR domain-containing protein [Spirochaetota bacterium]